MGPWSSLVKPWSFAASAPPAFIASKKGMPWSFGTKATVTAAEPDSEVAAASFFFVQPEMATADTASSAAVTRMRFDTFTAL